MPPNEHFLPRLLAPTDVLGGVRIGEILIGIIKMRRAEESASSRNCFWFGKYK